MNLAINHCEFKTKTGSGLRFAFQFTTTVQLATTVFGSGKLKSFAAWVAVLEVGTALGSLFKAKCLSVKCCSRSVAAQASLLSSSAPNFALIYA